MLRFEFILLSCLMLSWLFVGVFRRHAVRREWLDHPNERSEHITPTPYGAGIVFTVLWFLFVVLGDLFSVFSFHYLAVFLPGAIVVSIVGYLDDHSPLRPDLRMIFYLGAAIWGVWILGGIGRFNFGAVSFYLGWFGSILAVIAIAWSTNLFNFMDGSDGLAGSEAIFILSIGGILLWMSGGHSLAILAWGLAAFVAGFLIWNWPNAKIFMGDVGSVFLGFIIPMFALAGEKWYHVPALLWVILYTVFYVDTTITVLRRMFAGHRWYEAHRFHTYQRLHRAGWSHAKVLWFVLIINVVLGIGVLWSRSHPVFITWLFLLSLLSFTFLYYLADRYYPMFPEENKESPYERVRENLNT